LKKRKFAGACRGIFWGTNLPLDAFRRVQQPANGMFARQNEFSLTRDAENYFDAARHLSGILFRESNPDHIRTNADFNRTGKTTLCESQTVFFATS
jgi:hypothetical protein